MKKEYERQIIHILLGFTLMIIYVLFGNEPFIYFMSLLILLGLILVHLKMINYKIPFIDQLLLRLERPNEIAGRGTLWFIVGFLLIAFFSTKYEGIAIMLILTLGDAFSTIIGVRGKRGLPHNKQKTIEGTLAFIVFSLPAYYFVPNVTLLICIIFSALAESLDSSINDNVKIPIICILIFKIFETIPMLI